MNNNKPLDESLIAKGSRNPGGSNLGSSMHH